MKYYTFKEPEDSTSLEEILTEMETLPQFYIDSWNWGVESGMYALGFICIMALGVSMFKR